MIQFPVENLKKLLIPLALLLISGVVMYFLFNKESITLSGLVQANEFKNASLFGGRVKEVLVREGDTVKQGQEVVIFDDLDLKAKVAQAQAMLIQAQAKQSILKGGPDVEDVRRAKAALSQAEENLRMLSRGGRPEELSQAEAKVKEAQSRYDAAKTSFENAKRLLNEGIISRQKYDELGAQFEATESALKVAKAQQSILTTGARPEQIQIAKSQVGAAEAQYKKIIKGAKPEEIDIAVATIEQAESTLEALEAQLAELKITSPIEGSVSVLNVQPGQLVQPGRPVISIIDYSDLWTDIYVPETQLDLAPLNHDVLVLTDAFKGSPFQGKIVAINPKSEFVPNTKSNHSTEESSFRVKIRINPKSNNGNHVLLPGMKVKVTLSQS